MGPSPFAGKGNRTRRLPAQIPLKTRVPDIFGPSPSLPPSESEYESKPLLERSQLMPGCMTYGLR
jgi:hypothetical protein